MGNGMKLHFNRHFCGFDVVIGSRKYRCAFFWRPIALLAFEEWGPPCSFYGWLDWIVSRFVYWERQRGYIGTMFVIQRYWRVLNFAFGFREYHRVIDV